MTTLYATRVTDHFAARVAAWQAGSGAQIDFGQGTLVVGDGDGAVPALTSLIAAGGVTHEVWRGQTIGAVSRDAENPQQMDIECIIPAAIGGVEIGPFTVREFALLDEAGALCVVGTTNLEKTVAAQGQISDLSWIAAIVVAATDAVVVTPPGAGFAHLSQVADAVNQHHPVAEAPLTQTDVISPAGWQQRTFGARAATQALTGYGRAATDDEFAAGGAAETATFKLPWPTLAQVRGAFSALANSFPDAPGAGRGVVFDALTSKYLGVIATPAAVGVSRELTQAERVAGAVAQGSVTANPFLGLEAYAALQAQIAALLGGDNPWAKYRDASSNKNTAPPADFGFDGDLCIAQNGTNYRGRLYKKSGGVWTALNPANSRYISGAGEVGSEIVAYATDGTQSSVYGWATSVGTLLPGGYLMDIISNSAGAIVPALAGIWKIMFVSRGTNVTWSSGPDSGSATSIGVIAKRIS